jgi:hypothetical protein
VAEALFPSKQLTLKKKKKNILGDDEYCALINDHAAQYMAGTVAEPSDARLEAWKFQVQLITINYTKTKRAAARAEFNAALKTATKAWEHLSNAP